MVGGQVAVEVADAVFAEDFGVGVVVGSVVDGDAARAIGPEGDAGVAEVASVLTDGEDKLLPAFTGILTLKDKERE